VSSSLDALIYPAVYDRGVILTSETWIYKENKIIYNYHEVQFCFNIIDKIVCFVDNNTLMLCYSK